MVGQVQRRKDQHESVSSCCSLRVSPQGPATHTGIPRVHLIPAHPAPTPARYSHHVHPCHAPAPPGQGTQGHDCSNAVSSLPWSQILHSDCFKNSYSVIFCSQLDFMTNEAQEYLITQCQKRLSLSICGTNLLVTQHLPSGCSVYQTSYLILLLI